MATYVVPSLVVPLNIFSAQLCRGRRVKLIVPIAAKTLRPGPLTGSTARTPTVLSPIASGVGRNESFRPYFARRLNHRSTTSDDGTAELRPANRSPFWRPKASGRFEAFGTPNRIADTEPAWQQPNVGIWLSRPSLRLVTGPSRQLGAIPKGGKTASLSLCPDRNLASSRTCHRPLSSGLHIEPAGHAGSYPPEPDESKCESTPDSDHEDILV